MMKKIALLFFGILFSSLSVHAQSTDTKERIESQYVNAAHKAFIYQVSPQMKALDLLQLKRAKFSTTDLFPEFNKLAALSTDTTWSFSEAKAFQDSMQMPSEYSYRWNEGEDAENVTTQFNFFIWNRDSLSWFPKRSQKSMVSSTSPEDSSETLFYRNFDRNPYTGSLFRKVNTPTRNSNYESYRDRFTPEDGWQKDTHELNYRDENDRDTLVIEERYDPSDMMYKLSSEFKNIVTEEFFFTSSKSYNNDTPQTLNNWDHRYTKLGEGGRFDYQVTKRLNSETQMLAGRDSLQFIYHSDHVEGQVYSWDDSVWVIDTFYRSFQRTIPNPNPNDTFHPTITQVDSVINYAILPDTMDANGGFVLGKRILKTEFDYDENGNQIEVRGYTLNNDEELTIRNRTVRTFRIVGDRYVLIHQDTYTRDFLTGMLFRSGFFDQLYNAEGVYEGQDSYNLNAAGDTTGGRGNRFRTLSDGTRLSINLSWNPMLKELFVQNYRTNRATTFEDARYINQSSFVDPVNNVFSRQINVGGNYPGIFNDGPITIAMGDTLSFYVSARNIDFTLPDVAVTNMPATATYDPQTRKFFWIVDEAAPTPMTYTATNSQATLAIDVLFVNSGNIAVSNEDEVFIEDEFVLSQNYPNPFNPTTNIQFSLPIASEVSLKVYNLLGQEVATLVNGRLSSGVQVVQFDASNLASGVYLYRLQTAGAVRTKKMLLIK